MPHDTLHHPTQHALLVLDIFLWKDLAQKLPMIDLAVLINIKKDEEIYRLSGLWGPNKKPVAQVGVG